MKKRRLLAGLMSLAVVASLGSCEWKYDQNSDVSSDIVSTGNTDPSSAIYDGNDATHYGETHIVTYNLNGGTMPSGKSVSETVTWADYLDLPVPTKAGYVFVGWFYESSDVNDPTRQWTNSDAVYKDITLTAHWKKTTIEDSRLGEYAQSICKERRGRHEKTVRCAGAGCRPAGAFRL